jgi:hypothetical protein
MGIPGQTRSFAALRAPYTAHASFVLPESVLIRQQKLAKCILPW